MDVTVEKGITAGRHGSFSCSPPKLWRKAIRSPPLRHRVRRQQPAKAKAKPRLARGVRGGAHHPASGVSLDKRDVNQTQSPGERLPGGGEFVEPFGSGGATIANIAARPLGPNKAA
jgi:hypothetical protein